MGDRPGVTQWGTSNKPCKREVLGARRLGVEHRGEEYRVKLKRQVGTGKPAEAGTSWGEGEGMGWGCRSTGLSDWPPGSLEGRGAGGAVCQASRLGRGRNTWARVGHSWPWRGATSKSIRMAIWAGVAWAPAVLGPPRGDSDSRGRVICRWRAGGGPEGRAWRAEVWGSGLRAHWSSSSQVQPWPGAACPPTLSTIPRPPTPPEGHRSLDPRGTTT